MCGFGVPESVLEQVQASLVPPKRDPGNAREKALSDCKAQLHILRQRVVKQQTNVSNAQEALVRSEEKLTAKFVLATGSCLLILSRRLSSKVASEVGDGPHLAEVQSCTDGMDLTGQDGDLDHPKPPTGNPSPGLDRVPPSAPSAPFVQNEDASKRCRVATAFSHDSVLNAAVNGQLSQQDGAQLISGLCNLYGMAVPANCVPLESEGDGFSSNDVVSVVLEGKGKKGRKVK